MNLAFHHSIRFSLLNVMALKRSGKQQTQNFRQNDEDVIFLQVRIGLLGFSTWKCVNQNYRKP